jgi:hypothetical protein
LSDSAQWVAPAAGASFDTYVDLRRRIDPWRQLGPEVDSLTPEEARMGSALQPVWSADRDTLARWRELGGHVTGVHAADYVNPEPGRTDRLQREFQRLLAATDGLWVEEPAALGGFGLMSPEGRYNADTLRYLRAVALLQDAAVVEEFRHQPHRPVVWEIGAGWGGFAHHFTSLCPDVTYLMTGSPELLLLAAVYLATVAPRARFRLFDVERPDAFWTAWHDVDFALAPESIVSARWPVPVELTIDLAMLERMSGVRVAAHVQRAHASGSRYFLSECPVAETADALDVAAAIHRCYWPHPVCVPHRLGKRLALDDPRRTYTFGWRRLQL